MLVWLLLILNSCSNSKELLLAENGEAKYTIVLTDTANIAETFAAAELSKYLEQISNAKFTINETEGSKTTIQFLKKNGDNKDAYSIEVSGMNILLSGNSDRAILYAVYDLLGQCGCRWWAPQFNLYEGKAEFVPEISKLSVNLSEKKDERPAFAHRIIDVDGGRTHNVSNLQLMIDWMAKVKLNTLRVPVNLNGNGRVMWNKWKDSLLPELEKRDMLLEVGGHGYQNFLNADMEDKTLFKKHPEWFGKDSTCQPSSSSRLVFNTTDTAAVNYFTGNIINYIKEHPGINIFGIWPPDVGRWADCDEMNQFGTASDRQAALVNTVDSAIRQIKPGIRTEMIAYSYTLLPPEKTKLNSNILVDFCPINQSFEKQIFDSTSDNNREYVNALLQWRKSFIGDIGLYSYYRKYAWRSAPNVFPHYIQKEMQWYAGIPLQGLSTYAEPGDWYTYELNHYSLALTVWDPSADIDKACSDFFKHRYGVSWQEAKSAYAALESISPVYGSIPFTSLKSPDSLNKAIDLVAKNIMTINVIVKQENYTVIKNNFSRLLLMLAYLEKDLEIQELRANNAERRNIENKIHELVGFLGSNIDKGVFILTGQNDFARFTKKYGLTNQSLLD